MDEELTTAVDEVTRALGRLENALRAVGLSVEAQLTALGAKLDLVHRELMSIAEATTEVAEVATRQYKREIGLD